MHKVFLGLAVVVSAAAATAASDQSDVMATVTRFADSFNKGDTAAVAATCAGETSILDEFPPHEWHGAGACSRWMNDYNADAEKNGITDGAVTLDKPTHVDVSADRAYVVVPANYSFKQRGKPVKETGSILTVVLKKGEGGWRMIGWSWPKH